MYVASLYDNNFVRKNIGLNCVMFLYLKKRINTLMHSYKNRIVNYLLQQFFLDTGYNLQKIDRIVFKEKVDCVTNYTHLKMFLS